MSSSPPPPPAAATEVVEEEGTDDEETEEEEEEESEEEEDEEYYDDDDGEESSEEEDSDHGEEECRENGRRGGAGLLISSSNAVVEEDGGGAEAAAGPSCCVCMEPWDCDGAHRICCIPCGHVYGRSCLERWLRRCGNTSAKCPQCRQRFRHKHITDLYVSGNVWDGFCRLQLQEFVTQLTQLRSEIAKCTKFRADMKLDIAKAHAEATTLMLQFKNEKQSSCKESAQDAAEAVEAEFLSMKEQLRKMAEEQNATAMDMLRFMEQNGAKLWESISSRPPGATTTVED